MKTCIICRKEKGDSEFNDEHVIPDSINGYYHIRSVCTACNSKLGSNVDNKLTNHHFITFQRHTQKIAGKSGKIPNPFSGTHTLRDDKNQKLRLDLDEDGKFDIKLFPKIPTEFTESFRITVDKKDEHKVDEIINKFLQRNGIPREKVTIKKTHGTTENPWVQASMVIDIKDFKMAILKIAYEFAVDTIPSYFYDPEAIKISKVLKNCDFQNLYKNVKFIGNGFNREILQPFSHLIDFENNNHYLILFDSPELGLICIVNLFNVFNQGIILTKEHGFIEESMIIGKNDLKAKTFEKLSLRQVVAHTYSPIAYKFQYFFPDNYQIIQEFMENERHPDFSFYRNDNQTPFFDKNGQVLYANIDDKLNQPHLTRIPLGDTVNDLITDIHLDEELYLKLLPINKLYRVILVRLEQYKKNKL